MQQLDSKPKMKKKRHIGNFKVKTTPPPKKKRKVKNSVIFAPLSLSRAITRMGSQGGPVIKNLPANAGDMGSIPGSGRSPGGGIGYPLQSSWASLVAQLVKNPPAMWETWVQFLGWEDALEKGNSVFLPGEFRGLYSPWGHKKSDTTE